eukprot:788755-Rhodomonas_salina.2
MYVSACADETVSTQKEKARERVSARTDSDRSYQDRQHRGGGGGGPKQRLGGGAWYSPTRELSTGHHVADSGDCLGQYRAPRSARVADSGRRTRQPCSAPTASDAPTAPTRARPAITFRKRTTKRGGKNTATSREKKDRQF